MKVVFCSPSLSGLTKPLVSSLAASVPVIEAAGWEACLVQEIGNPYISAARATMLRKAMDANADVIVFLDYDLSFRPEDLLRLIETPDEVVCGTYRFKKDDEEYMASIHSDANGFPIVRDDGCIKADRVPAGFLKLTKDAVRRFMRAYPELLYGEPDRYSVDLFNHGAHKGVWYGEDYAFSRRWHECGGDIWLIPDIQLDHHSADKAYPGNFDSFMRRRPGGSDDPQRIAA